MKFLQWFKSIRYVQYISAIIASLGALCMGTNFSWSSPSIPMLVSNNSPIGVQLTHEQASWAASAFPLGMIPGSIAAGLILNRIGHKYIFVCCSVFFLISWIMVTLSNSLALLITGRMISGFAGGGQIAIVQLYVGEIADKDIRGRLAMFPSAWALVGLLIGLGIGPFISFHAYSIICTVIAFIFGLTVLFIPQSPYFLLKQGRATDAEKSLQSLTGSKRKIGNITTLEDVKATVEYQSKNKFTLMQLLLGKRYRKSLLMVLVIKTLSDFSGGFALNAYVQTVLDESESSLSPRVASVIYGVIQVVPIFISAYLIDTVGRRPLAIASSAGAAICLFVEGVYFYLKDVEDVNISSFNFVPILALCLYRLMSSLSLSSLSYVLVSELFSIDAKDVCALIFSAYASTLMFTNIKIFNPIYEASGLFALFWMFAASSLLALVFIVFLLPETKGKSFNAIQDDLTSK